jgi:Major tropism determinant N-terminal domain/Phage tail repeat like
MASGRTDVTDIVLKRGTAARWTLVNPVLRQGEPGFETDTGKLKIGDGVSAWTALSYLTGGTSTWGAITGTLSAQTDLQTALNGKANSTHTHAESDIIGLVSDLAGKASTVHTHVQSDVTGLVSALAAKEPTITAGTTAQYYRGDKSFQTLDKTAVGLGNVDNTSDVNKPVSTATSTALAGKEPSITAGTTSQYWRGDKSWQTLDKTAVGLGNVDNTSDASKPISTATSTALAGKQATLTLTTTGTSGAATLVGSTLNIPQYSGGGGGLSRSINSISTNTTGAASASTDYVYIATASLTFTLPTAVGNTNRYTVKNGSGSNITVNTTSSQTMDGSTSITLTPNTALDFISDSTNYRIV